MTATAETLVSNCVMPLSRSSCPRSAGIMNLCSIATLYHHDISPTTLERSPLKSSTANCIDMLIHHDHPHQQSSPSSPSLPTSATTSLASTPSTSSLPHPHILSTTSPSSSSTTSTTTTSTMTPLPSEASSLVSTPAHLPNLARLHPCQSTDTDGDCSSSSSRGNGYHYSGCCRIIQSPQPVASECAIVLHSQGHQHKPDQENFQVSPTTPQQQQNHKQPQLAHHQQQELLEHHQQPSQHQPHSLNDLQSRDRHQRLQMQSQQAQYEALTHSHQHHQQQHLLNDGSQSVLNSSNSSSIRHHNNAYLPKGTRHHPYKDGNCAPPTPLETHASHSAAKVSSSGSQMDVTQLNHSYTFPPLPCTSGTSFRSVSSGSSVIDANRQQHHFEELSGGGSSCGSCSTSEAYSRTLTPVNLHVSLPTPLERSPQGFNPLSLSAPQSGVNTPAPVFSGCAAHMIPPSTSSYCSMSVPSYGTSSSGTSSHMVSPTALSLAIGNGSRTMFWTVGVLSASKTSFPQMVLLLI
ncbi:hypothetical protein BC829DRAFT_204827 [Chytridium lagenaria]|nr:hypothetical protein BC829DRAFT_204827 [Chytridium lagenaria]